MKKSFKRCGISEKNEEQDMYKTEKKENLMEHWIMKQKHEINVRKLYFHKLKHFVFISLYHCTKLKSSRDILNPCLHSKYKSTEFSLSFFKQWKNFCSPTKHFAAYKKGMVFKPNTFSRLKPYRSPSTSRSLARIENGLDVNGPGTWWVEDLLLFAPEYSTICHQVRSEFTPLHF